MCRVYNTVGALTTIKTRLAQNKIEGFQSVQELISFQNNYAIARQQIISNQQELATAERNSLSASILELEKEIANTKIQLQQKLLTEIENLRRQYNEVAEAEKSIVQEFTYSFKALFIFIKINYLSLFSNVIIFFSVRSGVKVLAEKRKRFHYMKLNFEEAVKESCGFALHDLDRKKRVIDEMTPFIYGAIGEQKVADELKQLPDDYILINDFTYTFDRPLYHKQQRTKINTIQIDHLLISRAGVFLIETKNWSKESVQSLNLRSPLAQIQRASFALFILINRTADFKLVPHHWGERKIPIKNLIVLINHKPNEEFDYVKVLTLTELLGHVKHFKPSLSNEETQEIADYLVKIRN